MGVVVGEGHSEEIRGQGVTVTYCDGQIGNVTGSRERGPSSVLSPSCDVMALLLLGSFLGFNHNIYITWSYFNLSM